MARRLGPPAACAVLAVYATWPLARFLGSRVPFNLGDPLLITWIFGWTAHALGSAPSELFDANIFHPEPLTLAYTESFQGLAIPASPVVWLTGNALLASNLTTLVVFAGATMATYALIRELGGHPGAAAVAAVAYAYAPYRIQQLGHLHVVATHLLPVLVLLYLRMRDDPTRIRVAAFGAIAALQVAAAFTAGLTALVGVATIALWDLGRRRREALPTLARAAVGLVLAAVLLAPLLVPYALRAREQPSFAHASSQALVYSAAPSAYLAPGPGGLVDPLYEPLRRRFGARAAGDEKVLFPGVWLSVAILGAVGAVGASMLRRRWSDWVPPAGGFLLVAAVGFVLSLGPRVGASPDGAPLPFALLLRVVPIGNLRVPARLGDLVFLGGAVAAGLTLSAASPRIRRILLVVSVAVLAVELGPGRVPMAETLPIRPAHRAVADRPGAVLGLPTGIVGPEGGLRTTPQETVHMYLSTAHGRPMPNGFSAFFPASYRETIRRVRDLPSEDAMRRLAELDVRTVIVQTELLPGTPWEDVVARLDAHPDVHLVASEPQVRVYDVSSARPGRTMAPAQDR